MPKPRRKPPKAVHAHESGSLYNLLQEQARQDYPRNTRQTDVNPADLNARPLKPVPSDAFVHLGRLFTGPRLAWLYSHSATSRPRKRTLASILKCGIILRSA
jgi:hypothetical protein